ncbi:C2H2-type zinc finger transcription factor [Rhizophagus clarus]|uniref:C2H2-type zinc finger transcription factor n=1 Tax=Rhizophagus clarus TaxID=94130 RepID=A0A8H3QTH4_9GLOM|nr:C2H2-type zinc finger transcription factor [Rhizophagus clarus]
MDFTLPPLNLCVLELGPLCCDQSKSEVVKQYWTKRELENKIDIEENLHILDATKDVRVQGRLLRKAITKKLENRSGFEDNEKDPGKVLRKTNRPFNYSETEIDASSDYDSNYVERRDLSDEVDSFFKSPAKKKSSNLLLKKLQKLKDETDNEEGEINHRAEKHKLDKSSRCSDCDMEINIYELMRYCPYCGSKIMPFEVESDLEALDYDETDEENVADDINEDNDTPPEVDKVAFRMAYDAIPDSSKLRLSSTGRIVEDILFEFAKDMQYEHHAHSFIVDFDDKDIEALFDKEEWKELTKDPIGVPPVPRDIAKELTKYGKKTLKELRAIAMASYLKEEEEYDVNKHYEQEWIQMATRTLCNLYENVDAPLIRSQYEDWFTVSLFGTCIDFCIRDIQLGTDINRTDAPSLSSANRKNRGRKANTHTRKLIGRKIDGIIYAVDKLLEVGAIEGARSYSGASDQKYLHETFKMPKTLRDMYADLMRAVDYDDQKANKIQVIGILHLGLWIQFARLWRAGGTICIFRKDPLSHNVDSKFSEVGLRSFLKLLASIYQYKIIIKNNLQVLNIRNNANIKSGDDLLNELMEVGQFSSPSRSVSSPPHSVKFFFDCFKTPRKSRKKNPVKKRKFK